MDKDWNVKAVTKTKNNCGKDIWDDDLIQVLLITILLMKLYDTAFEKNWTFDRKIVARKIIITRAVFKIFRPEIASPKITSVIDHNALCFQEFHHDIISYCRNEENHELRDVDYKKALLHRTHSIFSNLDGLLWMPESKERLRQETEEGKSSQSLKTFDNDAS